MTADEAERFRASFEPALAAQTELRPFVQRTPLEELNPLKVLDLFKRMSDEVRRLKSLS